MDLTSKSTIKDMLLRHGIRPQKKFGQHFLASRPVLLKILQAADLKPTDVILEVGPGIGTLTCELAKLAKMVIAVEKDIKMPEILQEAVSKYANVELVQGDILDNFDSLPLETPYKVVANLPYYIAAPAIRMFLEANNPPEEMILMVQKEVGQRICAKPPRMSLLSVAVQFYAKPKVISYVPKGAFWPQPKVDSAIIRIIPEKPALPSKLRPLFFAIVKAGFSSPRKQLINNLSLKLNLGREETKAWLEKNNIAHTARAETLTLQNWANLTLSFKNISGQ